MGNAHCTIYIIQEYNSKLREREKKLRKINKRTRLRYNHLVLVRIIFLRNSQEHILHKNNYIGNIIPTQVEKKRAKLAILNDCAVPFLSRAVTYFNLCWYHNIYKDIICG